MGTRKTRVPISVSLLADEAATTPAASDPITEPKVTLGYIFLRIHIWKREANKHVQIKGIISTNGRRKEHHQQPNRRVFTSR
jgi:hypothetical protein